MVRGEPGQRSFETPSEATKQDIPNLGMKRGYLRFGLLFRTPSRCPGSTDCFQTSSVGAWASTTGCGEPTSSATPLSSIGDTGIDCSATCLPSAAPFADRRSCFCGRGPHRTVERIVGSESDDHLKDRLSQPSKELIWRSTSPPNRNGGSFPPAGLGRRCRAFPAVNMYRALRGLIDPAGP
jgi:hypothetical protein